MSQFFVSLGGLLEADVSGDASDLARDPLHALLALDDGSVDVVHPLDDVAQGVDCTKRKQSFRTRVKCLRRFK